LALTTVSETTLASASVLSAYLTFSSASVALVSASADISLALVSASSACFAFVVASVVSD